MRSTLLPGSRNTSIAPSNAACWVWMTCAPAWEFLAEKAALPDRK
jgi:hypothetical protein